MSTIRKYGVVDLKSESGRASVAMAGSCSGTWAGVAMDEETLPTAPLSTAMSAQSSEPLNIFFKSASKAEIRALEEIDCVLGI